MNLAIKASIFLVSFRAKRRYLINDITSYVSHRYHGDNPAQSRGSFT